MVLVQFSSPLPTGADPFEQVTKVAQRNNLEAFGAAFLEVCRVSGHHCGRKAEFLRFLRSSLSQGDGPDRSGQADFAEQHRIERQADIESADEIPFETFLENYFAQA